MFECNYKYELEDSIVCSKYIYKSQKRRQDKVIAILIPILMVCMVGMLIFDIVMKKSIVWDIVLLVALAVLEVMYLLIPVMLVRAQKKSYNKQNLGEMDSLLIKIDDNICTETLLKDGQEVAKNVHNLKQLTSYIEDKDRLILVFNKVEFSCIRKSALKGDLNKLKSQLEKIMTKVQNGKKR
ncbi:MAG: hypothetical protein ACLRFL_00335 [Clostridia bacterium]